jgi:hypothetical protein
MAKQQKLRRGTTSEHEIFIGAEGEPTYDKDLKTIRVHDGTTPGGFPLSKVAPAPYGKNAIIDGRFQLWEKGTSFVNLTTTGFTATMHQLVLGDAGTWAVDQVSDPSNDSSYGLKARVTTSKATLGASSQAAIAPHMIYAKDFLPFRNQALIATFRVQTNKAGTYCFVLQAADKSRSLVREFAISTTETGSVVTKSVSIPTEALSKGLNAQAFIVLANNSIFGPAGVWVSGNVRSTVNQVNLADTIDNYFTVFSIQLETGNVFTGFENDVFVETRAREFFALVVSGADQANAPVVSVSAASDVLAHGPLTFSTMRKAPVFSVSAASDFQVYSGGVAHVASALTADLASVRGSQLNVATTGLTANAAGWLRCNNASARMYLDARTLVT